MACHDVKHNTGSNCTVYVCAVPARCQFDHHLCQFDHLLLTTLTQGPWVDSAWPCRCQALSFLSHDQQAQGQANVISL